MREKEELTWETMKEIVLIADRLAQGEYDEVRNRYPTEQDYYEDVLRVFKEKNL